MNGAYIGDMVTALSGAGISDVFAVDAGKWSGGTALDAGVGVLALRDEMVNFPIVLRTQGDGNGQFNLVGYSFGSLVAAQVAAKHVRGGGVVDHLVLIGAPISKEFLDALNKSKSIKSVIVMDLYMQKDPIYAGMTSRELIVLSPVLGYQMSKGIGHFYYAPGGAEGAARRRELALELYRYGLR